MRLTEAARPTATVHLFAIVTAGVLFAVGFVGQLDGYDHGEIETLALILGLAAVAAVAVDGRRKRSRQDDDDSAAAGEEVERSVRDRLYGERAEITATPAPRPLLPTRDTRPRARRADPRGVGLVGGRYRLLERVGAGGMAAVYRARDERLKREVAVKVIAERRTRDARSARRFRREAELCARLAHPNIVAILDAGDEPKDFIVMELVRGADARMLLERRDPLTPDQALHVVAQVCDALAYAHDREVVHHDVSPGNILLRRSDGVVKLADFGVGPEALDGPAGRVVEVTGTPGYVAPEVLRGATPSPQSDLYSLGVVAYRLLAGPSRVGRGDPATTAPLPTAAPRIPPLAEARPGLPPDLIEAVERALAQEPDARQHSVAEFRAQLVEGLRPPLQLQRGSALFDEADLRELPRAA